MKYTYIVLATFCTFSLKAQKKVSAKEVLNKIWRLDTEEITSKYKYQNYEQYLIFNKNIENKVEMYPEDSIPVDNYVQKTEYYFLSDSVFNVFVSKEYSNDSSIISYFNKRRNSKALLDDIVLDFTKDIVMANVIYITREKGVIVDAHLYTYQFYDKNSFNQYGYGWTPGQPQNGYIYQKSGTIPSQILAKVKEIKKENFRKIKINKSILYNIPNSASRKYLISGDEIEILQEKGQWLKIRYYGPKIIEGWIKKSNVNNP